MVMDPLVSAADLAELQALSEASMLSTVVIFRAGGFIDEGGGAGRYAPPTQIPTKGRLSAAVGTEGLVAEQVETTQTARLALPLGVDILGKDTLTVDGVAYEVIGLPPLRSFATERPVLIRRSGA